MGRPKNSHNLTFWRLLEEFPPIMVRLLARRPIHQRTCEAVSHREIAITTGYALSRIIEISESLTWANITFAEAKSFMAACHFDPTRAADRQRQSDYIYSWTKKQPTQPPHYLQRSPYWATEFQPLILLLSSRSQKVSCENSTGSTPHQQRSAA